MEPAQDRPANELAGLPKVPDFGRPQGQAPVRPIAVLVSDELAKDRSQLRLVQHDQVVETLPPEGPHHALGDGIRLGRHHGSPDPAKPEPSHTRIEVDAVDPIAVMNQKARLLAVRCGIQELLPDPGHRWVLGDIEVDQVAAGMLDEEEYV
jgi:hypothetical protein